MVIYFFKSILKSYLSLCSQTMTQSFQHYSPSSFLSNVLTILTITFIGCLHSKPLSKRFFNNGWKNIQPFQCLRWSSHMMQQNVFPGRDQIDHENDTHCSHENDIIRELGTAIIIIILLLLLLLLWLVLPDSIFQNSLTSNMHYMNK